MAERLNCPMRHPDNGNCFPIGGFCSAINDQICEAVHQAHEMGFAAGVTSDQRRAAKPLTLTELCRMDGEPVWIESKPGSPVGQLKLWALVSVDTEEMEISLLNIPYGFSTYEEIAEDIQAIYRRPPREVSNATH